MSLKKRLHEHYHRELSLRRQIAIRALCSFLLTFGIARGYTYSVHYHLLPLRDFVTPSGTPSRHGIGLAACRIRHRPRAHVPLYGFSAALELPRGPAGSFPTAVVDGACRGLVPR
jgi:hypothetical protein